MLIPISSFGIDKIEKWDYFEISLSGPEDGNPFQEVELSAQFTLGETIISTKGFYNGKGEYKIRFMPKQTGIWKYITQSSEKKLNGKRGQFECVPATGGNHGMVKVEKKYHFRYSDGKAYYPFGTTAYAWTSQIDSLQEVTLETLASAPFNKLRMCVFPKTIFWKRFDDPPSMPMRERQHGERDIELPTDKQYEIEIIDTWGMTITKIEGLYSGKTTVKLPSKPYIALRIIAKAGE